MQKENRDTLFAIFQFLKDCCDSELVKLLNQFMRLLIEQVITYPVPAHRKKRSMIDESERTKVVGASLLLTV